MLSKFTFLILSLFAALGVSSLEQIQNEVELVQFINENIHILRDEYYKEFGEDWDVNYFVNYYELFDESDNLKAYLIEFDNGYLTVGLDLYLYEIITSGATPFYVIGEKNYLIGSYYYLKIGDVYFPNSKGAPDLYSIDGTSLFYDDIYIRLTSSNTNSLTNFKILYSIANELATIDGKYGKYNIYTRSQGSNMDCGAQAAINIVYTFQFSGVNDLAKSMNSNTELNTMRSLMNWTSSGRSYLGKTFYGIWPSEITSGLTTYLPSNYKVTADGVFGPIYEGPAIGLYYSLDVVETAHYAMIIGSAQSDAWWIFKTNYDIISHWNENYNHSLGVIGSKKTGTPSYYYVETLYRNGTYNIQESTGKLWWEVWKPAWINLVA